MCSVGRNEVLGGGEMHVGRRVERGKEGGGRKWVEGMMNDSEKSFAHTFSLQAALHALRWTAIMQCQ